MLKLTYRIGKILILSVFVELKQKKTTEKCWNYCEKIDKILTMSLPLEFEQEKGPATSGFDPISFFGFR